MSVSNLFVVNPDNLMANSLTLTSNLNVGGTLTISNGSVNSGAWGPTFSSLVGVSSVVSQSTLYEKIGANVIASACYQITGDGTGNPVSFISNIAYPRSVSGNFSAISQVQGMAMIYNGSSNPIVSAGFINAVSGSQNCKYFFSPLNLTSGVYLVNIYYQYNV